jgi:hypothetical protein
MLRRGWISAQARTTIQSRRCRVQGVDRRQAEAGVTSIRTATRRNPLSDFNLQNILLVLIALVKFIRVSKRTDCAEALLWVCLLLSSFFHRTDHKFT